MIKYLGELDDDDMVMFVVEHLKDHKPPAKIVEGLEPVSTASVSASSSSHISCYFKGPSRGSS
jgi:hypothetical protein